MPTTAVRCLLLVALLHVTTLTARAPRKEVTTPPQITIHPDPEYSYRESGGAGITLTLQCQARGNPEPEYYWKKDGELLNMTISRKMVMGEGTLTITNPSKVDVGSYQCYAKNDYGIALSSGSRISVAYLHSFATSTGQRTHHAVIGAQLKIRCSPPKTYPKGIIYWSRVNSSNNNAMAKVQMDSRISIDYEGNLYFANIELNDTTPGRRRYICKLYNPDIKGTMEGSPETLQIVPTDQSSPPFKAPTLRWHSPDPDIALEGKPYSMKCIFSGYPTPVVKWSRANGELPTLHSISDDGMELTIQSTNWRDAGTYICSATTPNMQNVKPVTRAIVLSVESPPFFRHNMMNQNEPEEGSALFECDVGGKPKPTIQWYANGEILKDGEYERRKIDGNIIEYTNLTKNDSEVLQCNASNAHGYIFANVFLNVLAEPPNILVQPKDVNKFSERQTVNLTCQVFGYPRPTILWFKDGKSISGFKHMSIQPDDRDQKNGGNLTIYEVKKEDEGLYMCEATNKFGVDSASGRLIVREQTAITVYPKDTTVNATEDVTLNCEATTDAKEEAHLTITWLRHGEAIDFENEPRINKNLDNTLTIVRATVNDSNDYTCVADNQMDKDEITVHVTVKDRPDPPKNVRIESCSVNIVVKWDAGKDNNAEVIEYILYYNTSFDDPDTYRREGVTGRYDRTKMFEPSPWANYSFHVRARNEMGLSDRSEFTTTCETPPQIPHTTPDNVCSASEEPDELVITWDVMPEIDHNGRDFEYIVHYRRLDIGNTAPNSQPVTDWKQNRYVVNDQEVFKEYEIYVTAKNIMGPSPATEIKKYIGYSGEGVPKDSPANLMIDEDSLNATSVTLQWDAVDESPERVQGHFIGYVIQYWREDDPSDKRLLYVSIADAVYCKPMPDGRQRKRRAAGEPVLAHINDLWPFSKIVAGVMVQNGASSGQLGDTITFTTPEGVPSVVPTFEVRERGSHHFRLAWSPPLSPNGILTGYVISWEPMDGDENSKGDKQVMGPVQSATITKLKANQDYRLYITAVTSAGAGDQMPIEDKTLIGAYPDKPGIGTIDVEETSLNVSFIPTDEDVVSRNPGSDFFVEYKKEGDDDWEQMSPEDEDQRWVNISGLDFGQRYQIRVVAVNGAGQEARSEPMTVQVGQEPPDYLVVDPSMARAGWFIGMMCAIIFLLIVLIIVCLIKRNRGGKYPVHEKEKLRARDPDRDDEERGFGEYTKTPYMELKSDEPDYKKSAGSLESESKPLDLSDSDSMAEYEDTDPSKFNEDGSFIGQYGGKKSKSKEKIEPDATSPSALSTFV